MKLATLGLFGLLDIDKDGQLSRDELSRATDLIERQDRDGDGQLSVNELRPAGGEKGAAVKKGDAPVKSPPKDSVKKDAPRGGAVKKDAPKEGAAKEGVKKDAPKEGVIKKDASKEGAPSKEGAVKKDAPKEGAPKPSAEKPKRDGNG
jgi:hypothetical protein